MKFFDYWARVAILAGSVALVVFLGRVGLTLLGVL
jgi:hypothetical protein